jgi:chromosome segregation ATPase
MKEAKEIELKLRILIQNYDEKFVGLQVSLKETNEAYGNFKGQMEKVDEKTKELEKETVGWQNRWQESNVSLIRMTNSHQKLQTDLSKVHESLIKMTSLYRALDKDRSDLLKKLNRADV